MSETGKLPLLKVNDIHVYYGAIHAIKGISLEVNEGEIVTLIGANGAGKSTTLNTIAGLLRPRQGSIAFAGMPVDGIAANKMVYKGLSLCPEGRRIFQQMTVKENLEMGAFSRPNEEIGASMERVYGFFPRLKEREKQVAGRRAADAGNGQGADEQTDADDAGRAQHGPGTDPCGADF